MGIFDGFRQQAPPTDAEVMQPRRQGFFSGIAGQQKGARQQEVTSRVLTEELETVLAEGGDSVDLPKAMAMAQQRAAKRIGEMGNYTAAQQLYTQSAAMLTAQGRQEAELGKLRAETDENTATAMAALRAPEPKDERMRLLMEREALLAKYPSVDSASPTGQSMQRRIDYLSESLGFLNTRTGRTAEDLKAEGMTPSTTTSVQSKLVSATERLARLHDLQASFDPSTLSVLRKAEAAGEWVADKFGLGDPARRTALTTWTNFSQAAYRDLNETIRELSGQAVTPAESERQLKVLMNPGTLGNPFSGDSPSQAADKLRNNVSWVQASLSRYQDLLKRGLLDDDGALDNEEIELLGRFPIESYIPATAPTAPAPLSIEDLVRKYAPQ